MKTVAELVQGLQEKDTQTAYACLLELLAESERGADVYAFFGTFAEMLTSDNSYLRSRGLMLIAANARWDKDHHVDEIIDEYLRHTEDVKPITARQCIQALSTIAKYKPELAPDITDALRRTRLYRYNATMQPLLQKDVEDALRKISAEQATQNQAPNP